MTKRNLLLLGVLGLMLTTTLSAQHTAANKGAFVAPTLEIAVLDPNADPLGRPAVQYQPGPIPGRMTVNIPETVLVHRFYYTGDRNFQAQLLPGGPCIVVVRHPRCGELLYVPVQMPPGAPRVYYSSNSIEYDFGKHGVTLRFCTLHGQPKVEYRNCMTLTRRIEIQQAKVNAACKEFADRSGITEANQATSAACKNVCKDTADVLGAIGRGVMRPVAQIGQLIPGAQMLQTTDEDRAIRLRDQQVKAAEKAAASKGLSIPQNR